MSKAYRVLIVEDEEIERNALSMMLKYNRQDIDRVQMAANGIAALDIYREFQPDIVLMDINLPGVNGLDVIRQMRFLPGNARFVIISAHSQFTYAQEAMRLDVQDFLVKPIRLEDISRVLDSLVLEIEQSRTQQAHVQYQQAKMEAIRPVLESDCILSIASMRSNAPIATIFDFMQITVASGFVFTLRGKGVGSLLLGAAKARIRNMGLQCIGEMINEICVCVALSNERIRPEQVQEIMEHLSSTLSTKERPCQISVGSVADCADDLRRSYEQAMDTARRDASGDGSLSFHKNDSIPEENLLGHITEASLRICQDIRTGKGENVAGQVHALFSALQLSIARPRIQEAVYWLYIMVVSNFPEQAAQLQPLTVDQIFAIQDVQALCESLIDAFLRLLALQGGENEVQSNQTVTQAIRIVKQRFQQDITLDKVADELNVSLFYLSKLFRRHTGITFTEYLTQLRVEKAKELLRAGEMSVKEVSYCSGFNSQGYFSKIFKKYTGVAPSEYRGQSVGLES